MVTGKALKKITVKTERCWHHLSLYLYFLFVNLCCLFLFFFLPYIMNHIHSDVAMQKCSAVIMQNFFIEQRTVNPPRCSLFSDYLWIMFVWRFYESDNHPDVDWLDWALCLIPTFLMFSSSSCLASFAVCSSFILNSSSSCSACCLSRRSRRFWRASWCGAGRPWRSRFTHVWMAKKKKSTFIHLLRYKQTSMYFIYVQ